MRRTCLVIGLFLWLALCFFPACDDDDDDDAGESPITDDDDQSPTDDDDEDDDADDNDDNNDNDDDADDNDVMEITVGPSISANDSVLPAEIESCSLIAAEECRAGTLHRCAIYDAAADEFPENPPAFLERILYIDRYGDLYNTKDFSQLVYYHTEYIAPGTPEQTWSAPAMFDYYRDHGDSAFYQGYHVCAAAHRFAVTGTDADYRRMVEHLERQLGNWRITGVPGYMIRAVSAMLEDGTAIPPGHPEYNLREYKERTNHVLYTVTEPDLLALLPAYYYEGVTIDDVYYPTTPMIEGGPSLDAYSGALLGFDYAYDLLRSEDQALKDEIAECVTCFIGRLRKIRVTNVQDSILGSLAMEYLMGTGSLHLDPDDINLDDIDTMVGYVAEAIPPDDPGDFQFECSDTLPSDVHPNYDWDANDPSFLIHLLSLAYRLSGLGDYPIDFVYLTSHRGGDVAFMAHWMTLAYHVTGDERYLNFIREALVHEIDGLAVLNTAGSFYLPPYCGSWIGGDLLHPIIHTTLRHLGDGPLTDELRRTLLEEFKNKLFLTDDNAYFGVTYGTVMSADDDPEAADYLTWAVGELNGYVIHPEYPLDPKRNYNTDYITDPLPDYPPTPPTAEEVAVCEQGFELFGIEIVPGPGVDPDFEVISPLALPVGMRVPHELIWHFSPFNLKRDFGDAEGRRIYMFTDLTVPFWIADYHQAIPDGQDMALGWQDTGEACK